MSGEQKDTERKKEQIWRTIFEAETPSGKAFDIALLVLITLSVITVCLETVESVEAKYGSVILALEWIFTIIFTIEYIIRLMVVRRPIKYATSFFGIVDLLSCLPLYLSLFLPATKPLLIIRVLRMLRIFRILKMVRHVQGARELAAALRRSRAKIVVFFFSVVSFTVIAGAVIYAVEGKEHGFTSIPMSIYWAIVTISTVGYGDITPQTPLGQIITSCCILIGYAIIAVPTGIITSALVHKPETEDTDACPSCGVYGHLDDAKFCRRCGEKM